VSEDDWLPEWEGVPFKVKVEIGREGTDSGGRERPAEEGTKLPTSPIDTEGKEAPETQLTPDTRLPTKGLKGY
jgi:hypothetical protein